MPRVVAIVPAHEEEGRVGRTVAALRTLPEVEEVVVVADGSSDGTAREAREAGARVLAASRRLGKGRAVESATARLPPADVYLLVDGDVAETAREAGALVEPVLAGRADITIARFPPLAGGGFGLVTALSRWLIRTACGLQAEAPISGQRAVTGEVLEGCRPLAPGFGLEVGMTIDAVRLGFRLQEVPVGMSHRLTRRDLAGFVHRGRQGVDILAAGGRRVLGLR